MILTFDAVGELLDDLYEEFPEALFQALNGGVSLLPEARQDDSLPGGVFILGEYCTDPLLGRFIHLYYGSFVAFATEENWSEEDWEEELYTTLAHELTHHVEGLAGERGLEIQDALDMEELRTQARDEGDRLGET